jgi:hypothetical protein
VASPELGRLCDVARLGRKTRIGGKQPEILWAIFERVRTGLAEPKAVTWPDLFGRVAAHIAADKSPFDFVVVDEAQDVGVAELRFLASLAANRADGLFLTGDLGQRIFQQPFSWRSLGVDVRGRSYTLRINYRTSHQIRAQADRLLPSTLADVDGNAEDRPGTVSVFNGAPPTVETFDDPEQEAEAVGEWIAARVGEGGRTRSAYSSARITSFAARGTRSGKPAFGRSSSPTGSRSCRAGSRSARCIWPRVWNFSRRRGDGLRRRGQARSSPAKTKSGVSAHTEVAKIQDRFKGNLVFRKRGHAFRRLLCRAASALGRRPCGLPVNGGDKGLEADAADDLFEGAVVAVG